MLGTIEDSDIIIEISANGTIFVEFNTTIVGRCHECQCLYNGTFVCRVTACTTATPTTSYTTVPICKTPWSSWSQCPTDECNATMTRTRECNMTDPNCKCKTPVTTEVAPCNQCTTPGRPSSTFCPDPLVMNCYNMCNDTCRYHQDPECVLTGDDCLLRCKCPEGYLEDDNGQCVKKEQCSCYHNGTAYPPGFNITYPDRCEQCTCDQNNDFTCSPVPGCCIYPEWSEWTTCNATCEPGFQTRKRVALNKECPENLEQNRPCQGRCVCVINGMEYENGTTFVPPDDSCAICLCMNNETYCEPDENLTVNGNWTSWGDWSLCTGSSNCRNYTRTRCRFCDAPKCGGLECSGSSIDVEPCNEEPCCDVYRWSDWSDCSEKCGDGVRTRYKKFADEDTARECNNTGVFQYEDCGNCESCPENDNMEWSDWSGCSATDGATCGFGRRTRARPGPACPGVKLEEAETCFLRPCDCPDKMVYSNHSQCQATCQQTYPDPACLLVPTPGCVCPTGTVMDAGTCVTPSKCQQCVYKNVTYKPGDQWECNCSLCQCCGGHITTVPRECPDISECDLMTHRLEVTDDECCPIKCIPRCELKTETPAKLIIGECVSQELIAVQYCQGECAASSHRVDYTKSTLGEKECSCCAARIASYRSITLDCPRGVTKPHIIPILGQCVCDVSVCPTGG